MWAPTKSDYFLRFEQKANTKGSECNFNSKSKRDQANSPKMNGVYV